MKELIKQYKSSVELVRERICELSGILKEMRRNGSEEETETNDLEKRIELLRTEYRQTSEIIDHLQIYLGRKQ